MTVKEFIQLTELAWMVIGFASLFHLIILIDTQPDRKTRKTLKKIAKEKNVKQYVIINTILRKYCEYYEKQKFKEEAQSRHENIEEERKPIQEEYFGQYDRYSDLTDEELRLALEMRANKTKPTYEEWKKEIESKNKKVQKVTPRKKHSE